MKPTYFKSDLIKASLNSINFNSGHHLESIFDDSFELDDKTRLLITHLHKRIYNQFIMNGSTLYHLKNSSPFFTYQLHWLLEKCDVPSQILIGNLRMGQEYLYDTTMPSLAKHYAFPTLQEHLDFHTNILLPDGSILDPTLAFHLNSIKFYRGEYFESLFFQADHQNASCIFEPMIIGKEFLEKIDAIKDLSSFK